MYALKPHAVYALKALRDDTDAAARMERMLGAIGVADDDVRWFERSEAPEVVETLTAWEPEHDADSALPWQHQRALVFTQIQLDGTAADDPVMTQAPDSVPSAELRAALGYLQLVRDTHNPTNDRQADLVCWNTQDFGLMVGCPHGCQYCGHGRNDKMIVVGANVAQYMSRVVEPTILAHPGQRCFRLLGWGADIATFEPEYGAFESFLSTLAAYDCYGYFHTAGDNVDWVEQLSDRDRLIGVWSLTTEAGGDIIEPGAPSPAARIAAARKVQDWGVPVRFKFKPTIPLRNWREEYSREVRRIFEHTRPESIGFAVLMWMPFERMAAMIDLEALDPEFVDAARSAADELRNVRTGPFPHHMRAQVYRFLIDEIRSHDPAVPIYVSTESNRMWEDLREKLGQNPRSFICGCNPIEAPGPRMLVSPTLNCSTFAGRS
jgi:hypothetical protein